MAPEFCEFFGKSLLQSMGKYERSFGKPRSLDKHYFDTNLDQELEKPTEGSQTLLNALRSSDQSTHIQDTTKLRHIRRLAEANIGYDMDSIWHMLIGKK